MSLRHFGWPLFALLLAGCDIPGMEPDPRIAQRESDARAIGSACRYALRGIEDCYTLNQKAGKSAVFAGWKEMDQYMRDNKIDGKASALPPPGAATPTATAEPDAGIDKDTEKVLATRAKPRAKAAPL